jgi:serine/threonine-protein kinase RsbW
MNIKDGEMEIIRTLLPTDLLAIKNFRDKVVGYLEKNRLNSDLMFKIKLVLDELIVNSYKHGNKGDYDKTIEATIILDRNSCTIKIKDEGDGINYCDNNEYLSEHGRGIKLVYNLSDGLLIKDSTVIAILLYDGYDNSIKLRCNT